MLLFNAKRRIFSVCILMGWVLFWMLYGSFQALTKAYTRGVSYPVKITSRELDRGDMRNLKNLEVITEHICTDFDCGYGPGCEHMERTKM